MRPVRNRKRDSKSASVPVLDEAAPAWTRGGGSSDSLFADIGDDCDRTYEPRAPGSGITAGPPGNGPGGGPGPGARVRRGGRFEARRTDCGHGRGRGTQRVGAPARVARGRGPGTAGPRLLTAMPGDLSGGGVSATSSTIAPSASGRSGRFRPPSHPQSCDPRSSNRVHWGRGGWS